MKTLGSRAAILSIGSVVTAAVLLACGDDDGVRPTSDAGADAQPETGTPDVATVPSDAGTDAPEPDTSVPRPPFDASTPAVACAVTPCIARIVAGPRNYCAIATDGVVRCWGDPGNLGDMVDSSLPNAGATPVTITGVGDIVDVGISSYGICAALTDGTVSCFGSQSSTPELVPDISGAKKLAVGDDRKCALSSSGVVTCWGDSYSTGQGTATVALGTDVATAMRMQWGSAFVLGASGTLYSWGTERYSLGRSTAVSPDLTPAPVTDLPKVLQFTASDSHVCAVTLDGRLYCWGRADNGALGLGYVRHEFLPVEVAFPGPAYPAQVAAAQSHSCARMTDGTLTCWGNSNRTGELGYAANGGVYIPNEVVSLTKRVVDVALAESSTCVVLEDGSVQCFGDNTSGQLAQSTRDSFRHPTPTTVVFP
jgi:alpha-tubulin suppressor-like RCC1 family protein